MGPAAEESGRPQRVAMLEERNLRISTAIAMLVSGGAALMAGTLLGSADPGRDAACFAITVWCVLAALYAAILWPRVSARAVYVHSNIVCGLGGVAVMSASLLSGGADSAYLQIVLFPALYAAYFFSPRVATAHLAFYTAMGVGVLALAASPDDPYAATRVFITFAGAWVLCGTISWHRRRLLGAEAQARRQALSDPLTGIHNLRSLRANVEVHPPTEGTGLLVIDIDNFKGVNSHYGHTGADRLLISVAKQLTLAAGDDALVSRIGGDEFVVLVRDRDAEQLRALVAECEAAVLRSRSAAGFGGPDLTASVGAAAWPRDGQDLSALLDAADHDMLARKRDSRRGRVDASALAPAADEKEAPHPALVPAEPAPAEGPQTHRLVAWWRGLPPRAVAGTAAWWSAAAATTAVFALSGAAITAPGVVVALIAYAVLAGALLPVLAPKVGEPLYVVSDITAVAGLVTIIALTGGTTSPLLPFVLVPVATTAYFSTRTEAMMNLAGCVVVCATPFLYASGRERLDYTVGFLALVTIAVVLTLVISRNRRALDAAERAAREQALQDPLTRLPNRRAFSDRLTDALTGAAEAGGPVVCAAIIDLDNFKRVNDRHGHAAGDLLLRRIGQALEEVVRHDDIVARVGGDEFAIVAPGTDLAMGRMLGERCVATVERVATRLGYDDCAVSATVGFALYRRDAQTADGLIAAADTALLRAKDAGKRRVACPDLPAA